MPIRVTVIVDSGGFLIDDDASAGPLDVKHFQTLQGAVQDSNEAG